MKHMDIVVEQTTNNLLVKGEGDKFLSFNFKTTCFYKHSSHAVSLEWGFSPAYAGEFKLTAACPQAGNNRVLVSANRRFISFNSSDFVPSLAKELPTFKETGKYSYIASSLLLAFIELSGIENGDPEDWIFGVCRHFIRDWSGNPSRLRPLW